MSKSESDNKKVCDFCNKKSSEHRPCIEGNASGREVFICETCCETCIDLCKDARRIAGSTNLDLTVPKPTELVSHMNEYIIGQDRSKRSLALAITNHYKRLVSRDEKEGRFADVELDKSNVLIVGPTGSGKTLLVETIAKFLNVPLAIGDATTLTQAGYVGEDVENLLLKLIQAADGDLEAAERGIIYIDEVDKIGATGGNVSITRDVSGQGVQNSLLKLIEGTEANIPPDGGRKHPEQTYMRLNTSNILFICGGTFSGLDKIVQKRVGKKSIGFGADSGNEAQDLSVLHQVKPEDLQKFGIIPELLGRLPVTTVVDYLTEEALCDILTKPKNAIVSQFKKLMDVDGVELEFSDEALYAIATEAKRRKTGARALRSVMEIVLHDIMYEDHEKGSKIVINEEIVAERLALNQTKDAA